MAHSHCGCCHPLPTPLCRPLYCPCTALQLDIGYDSFIRTTDPKHESLVASVLESVWARGDIYKADYEGYYCVDCEEYKDEADMDAGARRGGGSWHAEVGFFPRLGHSRQAVSRRCPLLNLPLPHASRCQSPADKNCPVHRKPCANRKEENYFFALSKYQAQLEELLSNPGGWWRAVEGWGHAALWLQQLATAAAGALASHQFFFIISLACTVCLSFCAPADFVQPESRRNEVLGWVKSGARDFSISRAAVEWGIPIPRDPKQTVYVWFDALNGYLSGE